MKALIEIDMSGPCFRTPDWTPESELARILKDLGDKIKFDGFPNSCYLLTDSESRFVGQIEVKP